MFFECIWCSGSLGTSYVALFFVRASNTVIIKRFGLDHFKKTVHLRKVRGCKDGRQVARSASFEAQSNGKKTWSSTWENFKLAFSGVIFQCSLPKGFQVSPST